VCSRLNVYVLLQYKASLTRKVHLTRSTHAGPQIVRPAANQRDRRRICGRLVTGPRYLARTFRRRGDGPARSHVSAPAVIHKQCGNYDELVALGYLTPVFLVEAGPLPSVCVLSYGNVSISGVRIPRHGPHLYVNALQPS